VTARLVRTSLRQLSLVQIRHVAPVPFRTPNPVVSRVYRACEREFGVLAPPLALHASSPEVLAAAWTMLRESIVAPGMVGRAEKETVAAVISASNSCPYCVAIHTSMVRSLGDEAMRSDIAAWARANTTRPRDHPAAAGPAGDDSVRRPLFPPDHGPELVAVAVLLHYLNRMVNVFLTPAPLPPGVPTAVLRVVSPVLNWLQHAAGRDGRRPGLGLDVLTAAEPAADLLWTAGNPVLTDAFARAVAVVDAAGERALPAPVRELVRERVRAWDGRPVGPSRAWVETAIVGLAPADRPAGRLALLTALASYQIDAEVIGAFQADHAEDARLIDATAWAALSAAREAGGWMQILK
jgi:AhpD family alkylhydroperoxidase